MEDAAGRRIQGTRDLAPEDHALALHLDAADVIRELLGADALGLGVRCRAAQRLIESLPAFLPVVHRLFCSAKRRGRCILGGTSGGKARLELRQRRFELRSLLGVTRPLLDRLVEPRAELSQLLALARAELTRVFDRLLGTGNLGTDFVVAPLHRREPIGVRGVLGSRSLDGRLERALLGERGLQCQVPFAHDGGPGSRLGLHFAQSEGEQLRLVVSDQGPGISPDEQRRIFDRFYRTRQARGTNVRGSGIGLALVKHIAEAHRGQVWVESEPGRGASFIVELPLHRRREAA